MMFSMSMKYLLSYRHIHIFMSIFFMINFIDFDVTI
jgi:hypothetical protein